MKNVQVTKLEDGFFEVKLLHLDIITYGKDNDKDVKVAVDEALTLIKMIFKKHKCEESEKKLELFLG